MTTTMNWTEQLRNSLWRTKPVRQAYWSARRALRVSTTQQNEIIYRIHCRSLARDSQDRFFKFPWGIMEIEGFRWALLGAQTAPGPMIGVSALASLLLLISGAFYFRRMERTFADVI